MQNLSAAHRQISASTIERYRSMATPYRDGTWNHDVSQNIQALLAAIAGASPYRILELPPSDRTGGELVRPDEVSR